jgi:hypothetical protein
MASHGDLLAKAGTVVVVGYSFASAGEHFNDLLRRSNPRTRILLVNPDTGLPLRNACRVLGLTPDSLVTTRVTSHERRTAGRLTFVPAKAEEVDGTFVQAVLARPLMLQVLSHKYHPRGAIETVGNFFRMRAGGSHIRDHLTYEESHVCPKLQLVLHNEELERLGTRLHQAKRTAPTRRHVHTPPDARLLRPVGSLTGLVARVLDLLTMRGR